MEKSYYCVSFLSDICYLNTTFMNIMENDICLEYNTRFVYCRELTPGTVSLTGDWVRGDDIKLNSYYTHSSNFNTFKETREHCQVSALQTSLEPTY